MARNKSKKSGGKPKVQTKEKAETRKKAQIVTMQALEEMSTSSGEGEMPSEAEWNKEALELKNAIQRGDFDALIDKLERPIDASSDEDEIEDVVLGDDDDDDDDESANSTEGKKHDKKIEEEDEEMSGEEEEGGGSDRNEEDIEADEKDASVVDDDDNEEEESNDDMDEAADASIVAKNSLSSKALHIVTAAVTATKKEWPWGETFDVIPKDPLPFGKVKGIEDEETVDIHDDLKREVAFYDMALQSTLIARAKCHDAKIPFSRPDDFFAEMVKTDSHMAKIKDRLIFETKKMEAVAQRKSNKEQKLRAKESNANKLIEKAKRKKDHFKAVEDWAQSAAANRGGALHDNDESYLGAMNRSGKQEPSKKRQRAEKKFGFGGKRGRFKQNDQESMNDMSGYNPRGSGAGSKKVTKSSSAGGGKRKGKRARDAGRSRR